MLQAITELLRGCSALKNRSVTMNFLDAEPDAVAVKAVACNPVLDRYADGGTLRQFVFSVLLRESGNGPVAPTAFYDALAEHMEEELPTLSEGKTPQRFEIVSTAAPDEHDFGSTRYELVCRLIYYQKGV